MKHINWEPVPGLGDRLREARARKRLTQWDLAVAVGVGRECISWYENGHHTPALQTLLALAIALDVTTDWLLGR